MEATNTNEPYLPPSLKVVALEFGEYILLLGKAKEYLKDHPMLCQFLRQYESGEYTELATAFGIYGPP